MREGSKGAAPEGAKAVQVNFDDEASLVAALKGQQFLIITLGVQAPPDLHNKIVVAASKAGVAYIMPNVFGSAIDREDVEGQDWYTQMVVGRIDEVEKTSSSPWVVLGCGFWYEWSLALGEQWFGISIRDRTVTFFDDGKRILTVSTWNQCGRAVAGLLSLPESGASPSLSDFANKQLPIKSFRISQRDMLDSVHRVLGTTDADWKIKYETTDQRIVDGDAEMKAGDMRGFAKKLYATMFAPANKAGDYGAKGVVNDVLGLPVEDLDEATKRAVDMVQSGWNPFA